jgi:hypothetical protein
MQRGLAWCLLAVMGAGAFSGCLDDGSSLSLDRPLWSSGYSFAYEIRGESNREEKYVGGDESGQGSETDKIGPYTSTIEILNTTRRNGDVPLYLGAMTMRSTDEPAMKMPGMLEAQLTAYRQRDLASVPVNAGLQRDCEGSTSAPTAVDCTSKLGPLQFGDDPEVTYLDFPLHKGKTWSKDASDVAGFDDADLKWNVHAEVGSPTTVRLPMGSVRALPVDFKFTPLDLDEFVREQKEDADGDVDAFDFRPYYHLKVYYAEDYQTVVRSEVVYRLDVRWSGHDDEGKAAGMEGHYEASVEEVLVGARLVALPERNLDYIGRVLGGEIDLNDPVGQARRSAGYTLEVIPSQSVLNAADKPVLRFEAKVKGDPLAFEGHTAKWRLLDYVGKEVAAGDGLSGSKTIDGPGHYTIEFETRDAADQVTAAATAFVVANYEANVHVECPMVGVDLVLPMCPGTTVPVRPGIQSVVVSAVVASPLAPLVRGTLTLSDSDRRQWTDNSSPYGIVVTDFSDADVNEQDWTLEFSQLAEVSQGLDYVLRLTYDPDFVDPCRGPPEDLGIGAPLLEPNAPC